MSSLKQLSRCSKGISTRKANKSSMKVFKERKTKACERTRADLFNTHRMRMGSNLPVHVGHGLEFVVDEQLRSHEDEAEQVEEGGERGEGVGVKRLVLLVHEGVDGVAHHLYKRKQE